MPRQAEITGWVKDGLTLVKIGELLERRGTAVPYRTLARFAAAECGYSSSSRQQVTVPVADGEPGEEVLCGKPHRASAPGACACGTVTCTLSRPSSARRRATYRDTVTSATLAPCSATSRCQTRRAVCRCLRGTSRSASSHSSITAAYGPIAGLGRGGYVFRGGGTALASACRTVRRCT